MEVSKMFHIESKIEISVIKHIDYKWIFNFYEGRRQQNDKYRWKSVACVTIAENGTI